MVVIIRLAMRVTRWTFLTLLRTLFLYCQLSWCWLRLQIWKIRHLLRARRLIEPGLEVVKPRVIAFSKLLRLKREIRVKSCLRQFDCRKICITVNGSQQHSLSISATIAVHIVLKCLKQPELSASLFNKREF